MGKCHVADVDKREDGRGRMNAVAHAALHKVADPGVGRIDRIQAIQTSWYGAESVGVVDGSECKGGFVNRDEAPGSLFGEFLGGALLVS